MYTSRSIRLLCEQLDIDSEIGCVAIVENGNIVSPPWYSHIWVADDESPFSLPRNSQQVGRFRVARLSCQYNCARMLISFESNLSLSIYMLLAFSYQQLNI